MGFPIREFLDLLGENFVDGIRKVQAARALSRQVTLYNSMNVPPKLPPSESGRSLV